jgi:NADPH:quinone reductase-like Zn-dependent oxidoreductase
MPPAWLLVNGAGGGVGGFTVQLAKEAGAIVIATASPRSTDPVRAFGADHIVDYTATTIAEAVKDPVDVVVNLVAGSREDTEALLDVTKPGGVLVSACGARIHDRGGDLLLLAAGRGRQAAIWYSCVSPPRTCFRRIRYSARLISGGRVSA